LIAPGAATTAVALPPQLSDLFERFSNVTTADFALLQWAATHLPDGARVLVAPGSAAEFLPAYHLNIVLLFPMSAGYRSINASYGTVVSELTNGTLDSAGRLALASLGVEFVAVTERNTVLFEPFSPAPFLSAPAPLLFHEGGAYLFAWPPAATAP